MIERIWGILKKLKKAPPLRFERRLLPPEGSALSSELWGLSIEEFYHAEKNKQGISSLVNQPDALIVVFFYLILQGYQVKSGLTGAGFMASKCIKLPSVSWGWVRYVITGRISKTSLYR